ncbi:hypothetical protein [Natronorubrum sp. A-ect3]|uniref:hypothetical protein n=1 Tax=Natronorubrum sp. A-ect3 TaxID=3242698 RepID=UPI00359D2990
MTRNPLDDYSEYYCYACNVAFDRLGSGFDLEQVEEDELVTDDLTLRFTVETTTYPDGLRTDRRITLRNDGPTPVAIREWKPIALQHRVGKREWVTPFGNPDAFAPSNRSVLNPDSVVTWKLTTHPQGFKIEDQTSRCRPLLSGECRFVYWGITETEAVLATRFQVEFDRNR